MHIPKAARLTLKHLFKFDDAFFETLERIDIDKLQSSLMEIVQDIQHDFPLMKARLETMETNIRIMRAGQDAIHSQLEEIIERMDVKDGGIPRELSVSIDFPGKGDVETLLLQQSEETGNHE